MTGRLSSVFLSACAGCIGLAAQTSDYVYSGEQASGFDDILVSEPSATDKRYLRMETLWEMDLSKAANGEAANDAYQNNHNLFVTDGKLCVYVEQYQPPAICLRYVDPAGNYLKSVSIDIPEGFTGNEIHKMVFGDDNSHIVLVGYTENGAPNKPVKIKVNVYDLDLELLSSMTYQNPEDLGNHILQYFEWGGLSGDALSGDFSLTIGGWHNYKATDSTRDSYASTCTFSFTSGDDIPAVDIIRYASGNHYSFESRRYDSLSDRKLEGMLFSTEVGQGKRLVQGFGTVSSHFSHSPILLYDDIGESDTNSSVSSYPLYSQSDVLDNPDLVSDSENDKYCFGVYPVKVADEQLLVLPYKFNTADGVRFKVARWPDVSSFDNVDELWQFPNKNTFPFPENIYDYTRPKVAVIPDTATEDSPDKAESANAPIAETTFCAYMPSSLLGAYKISLAEEPIASKIGVPQGTNQETVKHEIEGRTLKLSGCHGKVSVEIFSMSGEKLLKHELVNTCKIFLGHLPSGIYILRINGDAHKIVLR